MLDDLGDRMKTYEARETAQTFLPMLPIYARIDGRGFSKFTKPFKKPYDERMAFAMVETTKKLVEETNAIIGYTQSDEISLAWYHEDYKSEMFFAGKKQKLVSVLASLTTSAFFDACLTEEIDLSYLRAKLPHFDCRVFQLPNKDEVANSFLWREKDATKNAISMAAQRFYSHKDLQGKSSQDKINLLRTAGIDFYAYPAFFRQGVFVRRELIRVELDAKTLEKIPVDLRPNGPVTRSRVNALNMPSFTQIKNRVGLIFDKEEPIVDISS